MKLFIAIFLSTVFSLAAVAAELSPVHSVYLQSKLRFELKTKDEISLQGLSCKGKGIFICRYTSGNEVGYFGFSNAVLIADLLSKYVTPTFEGESMIVEVRDLRCKTLNPLLDTSANAEKVDPVVSCEFN